MTHLRAQAIQNVVLMLVAAIVAVGPVCAQQTHMQEKRAEPKKMHYRLSYTPLYQFDTDLERGGSFDVHRHFLRFDVSRIIDRNWMVGLGLGFDYERWNFSGSGALAVIDPWDEIVRPGISIPIIYSTASRWRWMVVPSLEFAGASGAQAGESLSYGAVLSAAHAFNSNLMVGFGAGVFDRLDEWEAFPFVVIDWRIKDRFKICNPFTAGPVGPAGLELVYTPSDRWDLGVGGAYRSYRFRLDDSSSVADGIGEVEFLATFLRFGWRFGKGYQLDLNGGALFSGNITIDDENGNELGETDYDTSPFVGVTMRGQF